MLTSLLFSCPLWAFHVRQAELFEGAQVCLFFVSGL